MRGRGERFRLELLSKFPRKRYNSISHSVVGTTRTHAEAAVSPRPREPPVTTATLPLRLNKEVKSWMLTSSMVLLCTV